MNLVTLIGRLGREPSDSNGAVKFSLATNRIKEGTDWHNVVCFGKTGEIVLKYVNKGDMLAVTGRIEYSQYENKDGVKMHSTAIIADRVELLPKAKHQETEQAPVLHGSIPDLDDIPF